MEKRIKIVYLDLDSSYYFIESTDLEQKIIKAISDKNNNENNDIKNKISQLDLVTSKYFENFFEYKEKDKDKDKDNFLLSHFLSKYFCKKKDIKKDTIEKSINYLFFRRNKINRTNSLSMKMDIIESIGNILSYSFSRLDSYKIKNKKDLIVKVKENNVNILTDFFQYCNENGLSPNDTNKTQFWTKNKKKYMLPPELIFLINLFSTITFFDFDINCQNKSFKDEQLKYCMLVLLNFDVFMINLEHFKFNLIHEQFQESYNSLDLERVKNAIYPDPLKINFCSDNDNLFSKKWNFEHNFMLDEFRNIEDKKKKKKKLENTKVENEFCDFTIINEDEQLPNPPLNQCATSVRRGIPTNLVKSVKLSGINIFSRHNTFHLSKQQTFNQNMINNFRSNNINDIIRKQITDLCINHRYCFEIIFILFYALNNYKEGMEIDLIMNYSYNTEITRILNDIYKIDIKQEVNDFHFLDLYLNSLKSAKSLNLEVDCFDLLSMEKILYIILYNTKIKKLKSSFFTSDINYFPHKLLRTYINSLNKKYKKNFYSQSYENIILSEFYSYFKNNLLYLFYLIKKKTLNSLGLNFDIPILIQRRSKYMMTILKFLLNILIYINDPKCALKDLTLLSPHTILDGRTMNNIDKIFEQMHSIENKKLTELNLQFTIYEIPHIKNVVINNLEILRIGNLDLVTFESLTNHLNSFNFARDSSLKQINIKLMKSIENLSPKIKIILRTLFNIKLKDLTKLGLFTNITIKDKKECTFLSKILSDNWIPSYTLLFNENSNDLFKKYLKTDEITFLVPHNLEKDLIGINNKKKNISTNADDIVFWYLKYMFSKKFYYKSKNFKAHKYYIYNILKYLYCEKKIKIFYEINEDI